MIPPCDPSILENNPQFKRLYENLTANLLNPDGSTRAHSADPTREAVAEVRRGAPRTTRIKTMTKQRCRFLTIPFQQDLKQCQIRSAKKRIKEQTLKQLAFAADSGLPSEVRSHCIGLNAHPARRKALIRVP